MAVPDTRNEIPIISHNSRSPLNSSENASSVALDSDSTFSSRDGIRLVFGILSEVYVKIPAGLLVPANYVRADNQFDLI